MTHIPTPVPEPRPVKRSSPPRFSTVNAVLFRFDRADRLTELVARNHSGRMPDRRSAPRGQTEVLPSTRTSSDAHPRIPRARARAARRPGVKSAVHAGSSSHTSSLARHEIGIVGARPDIGRPAPSVRRTRPNRTLRRARRDTSAPGRPSPSPRGATSASTGAAPGSACCHTGRSRHGHGDRCSSACRS